MASARHFLSYRRRTFNRGADKSCRIGWLSHPVPAQPHQISQSGPGAGRRGLRLRSGPGSGPGAGRRGAEAAGFVGSSAGPAPGGSEYQ